MILRKYVLNLLKQHILRGPFGKITETNYSIGKLNVNLHHAYTRDERQMMAVNVPVKTIIIIKRKKKKI